MADTPPDGARAEILHAREGRVGYLTIDRPPLNILTIDAFHRMSAALDGLLEPEPVDILVIRSALARAFSAGADVAEHRPDSAPRMLEAFHGVARRLWSMPVVSVAAVRGLALGGGMELALCCDLVVASEDAQFGQPEIQVGSFPPIAAAELPHRLGRQHAFDLVLTGRRVSAFEALALGLASRVASEGEFDEELGRVIESLLQNSGAVMRCALKALRQAEEPAFLAALAENERIYRDELLALPDAREGIEAFLQKRKPRWTSR
ncbi:MAG TPA: enoyl-CoA hydratase/isomerase family protein [Candidatus Polarisedimenticolia bacterium]|nr:enoyl-CoA hydratase/isomerase family protein [Candidatus Polarisedimenticolia bacterium]